MRSTTYQIVNVILLFITLTTIYHFFTDTIGAILFSVAFSWGITMTCICFDLYHSGNLNEPTGIDKAFLSFSLNNSIYTVAITVLLQTDILFISQFLGFEQGGCTNLLHFLLSFQKLLVYFLPPHFFHSG